MIVQRMAGGCGRTEKGWRKEEKSARLTLFRTPTHSPSLSFAPFPSLPLPPPPSLFLLLLSSSSSSSSFSSSYSSSFSAALPHFLPLPSRHLRGDFPQHLREGANETLGVGIDPRRRPGDARSKTPGKPGKRESGPALSDKRTKAAHSWRRAATLSAFTSSHRQDTTTQKDRGGVRVGKTSIHPLNVANNKTVLFGHFIRLFLLSM